MNLSVKDVAGLLNVSDKTIYRMIQNETIPCFRVGGQWRFDRAEIASWLEDTRGGGDRAAVGDSTGGDEGPISIAELLLRGGVYFNLPGNTKEAAVRACLDRIKTAVAGIDVPALLGSVMEREALCPTAVGHGIAFPHPKSFGMFTELSYVALCRLKNPLPFGALDNEDVDTLFFIFPKDERRFLRIQSKLLRLLRDGEFLSRIKGTGSAEDIIGVFSVREAELSAEAANGVC